MSKMFFMPMRPAFDSAGVTVPGAQFYFTLTGTNTPSAPFADAGLTTPLENPVEANGVGYLPPVYLDPAITYRVRVYAADAEAGVDTPLEEFDPYVPALANADIFSDFASVTGADLVGFSPMAGTGVTRSVRQRLSDVFNAIDFGATSAVAAAGIIAALNATPALGGKVEIPAGTWALASDPSASIGTKSVYFDIHPDAVFTGAGSGEGKFAYMKTNPAQLAVGPYLLGQTHQKSTNANGGTGLFNVEAIQPSDYGAGQTVGIYAGAQISCANSSANGWAVNFLGVAQSGALGTMTVAEFDGNNFSASATVKGVSVSGTGTHNGSVGVEVVRAAMAWNIGVSISKSVDALVITPNAAGRGLVVHSPTALVQGVVDVAMSVRQFSNGKDTVMLQRFTDTSPTGYFWRAVNAANNSNLFSVGVNGDVSVIGLTASGGVSLTALGNYANDSAAATGGVTVGQLYRNGSVVQVRVS